LSVCSVAFYYIYDILITDNITQLSFIISLTYCERERFKKNMRYIPLFKHEKPPSKKMVMVK